jgi:excisionase family DNA binding protein
MGKYMSPQEFADLVGVPLHTVYSWHADGTAPRRIRIGKHCRYAVRDIEEWLERHVVENETA